MNENNEKQKWIHLLQLPFDQSLTPLLLIVSEVLQNQ